eukprot:g16828.t1
MSSSDAQMEESQLLTLIRKAHSMAMKKTAAELGPEVLRKDVKPLVGKVGDVDPTALAVRVVARVVEKSEEAFEQLCERRSVNEKFLALERASDQQQRQRPDETVFQGGTMSDVMGPNTPLPGGRQPAELVRESTMKLKLAERDRLLALAEEAERAAEAEEAKVAEVEAELGELLEYVMTMRKTLAEASSAAR